MNSSSEVSTTVTGVRSFLRLLRRTMEEKRGSSWCEDQAGEAGEETTSNRTDFIPFCAPYIRILQNRYCAIFSFFYNVANKKTSKRRFSEYIAVCIKGRTCQRSKGRNAQKYRNRLYPHGSLSSSTNSDSFLLCPKLTHGNIFIYDYCLNSASMVLPSRKN